MRSFLLRRALETSRLTSTSVACHVQASRGNRAANKRPHHQQTAAVQCCTPQRRAQPSQATANCSAVSERASSSPRPRRRVLRGDHRWSWAVSDVRGAACMSASRTGNPERICAIRARHLISWRDAGGHSNCLPEEDGSVLVRDDLDALLQVPCPSDAMLHARAMSVSGPVYAYTDPTAVIISPTCPQGS